MRNVNIPYNIVGDNRLTHLDKSFLLWCWSISTDDYKFYLMSDRQYCFSRGMTIQKYANILGIRREVCSRMFTRLIKLGVIAEKEGRSCYGKNTLYIDYEIFSGR
jgi:hypothetical protein